METKFKLNGLKFKTNGETITLETDLPKSVDRAVRKAKSIGQINTSPKKDDCLAFWDKKTQTWVFKGG